MKSQVTALEFVLNILLLFTLFVYAYFWSSGIFEKTLDKIKINKAERILYELDERIQRISKAGGKDVFYFEIDGTFELKRNTTNELFNYIEIRIRTSEVSNTTWVYVNSYNTNKIISKIMETPSIIRKKHQGDIFYLQLFYRIFTSGTEASSIIIEPRFNWICSGKCEITIEKVGERTINFNGYNVQAPVVRLDIK
ncbi:MAG TPA: hypothetical protein EYH56_00115 [Nanoarchaeota archaeon]|nr:hypothetical protein [Nanoarchaeota archaeon]